MRSATLILIGMLLGFRQNKDLAKARQLFCSLALMPLLEESNPWKAADNYSQLSREGITVRKTINGIVATACIEANLPLLFTTGTSSPTSGI